MNHSKSIERKLNLMRSALEIPDLHKELQLLKVKMISRIHSRGLQVPTRDYCSVGIDEAYISISPSYSYLSSFVERNYDKFFSFSCVTPYYGRKFQYRDTISKKIGDYELSVSFAFEFEIHIDDWITLKNIGKVITEVDEPTVRENISCAA